MKRLLLALGTVLALALPGTAAADLPACSTTTSTVSTINGATPGSTVCLADGTYGNVSVSSSKSPRVTVRAEHPGKATVGRVTISGSNWTFSQLNITDGVNLAVGANGASIEHNKITAPSMYGVVMSTDNDPTINDVSILYNRFVGRMDEDQIRANGYHDSNGDGYGLRIEGNEFTGNVEYGGHNDVFQSVWGGDHLVFRKNYLHDFGGQGFFVKDQPAAVDGVIADDNLITKQNLPCDPASLCSGFQLSPFQVYGPVKNVSMQHNTVGWSPAASGGFAVLTGSYSAATFAHNTFNTIGLTNGAGSVPSGIAGSDNSHCSTNGWTAPPGSTVVCSPTFVDPANGDFRQASGRGVDWKVGDWTFGPETAGPPPPPVDTDGDGVPDSSDACPNQAGTQPNGCPPPDPTPDYQALYEAEKAKTADLTAQLAAMTTSRDNVQAIADAYKARAEAAEGKLAQIHTLSAP